MKDKKNKKTSDQILKEEKNSSNLNKEKNTSKEKKQSYKSVKKDLKKRIKSEKRKSFKDVFLNTKGFKNKIVALEKHIAKYKYGYQESEYIIELKDVQKFYSVNKKAERALKDINFKIPKGKTLSILGPSGSGKTSLLNIISGLITAEKGDVVVANKNLSFFNEKKRTKFREKEVSFIFQRYNLLRTLKCRDNIALGLDLKLNSSKDAFTVEEIAKILSIENQLDKYPGLLSGGQQQRVSIGRALIKNPSLLLADEPTGALDEGSSRSVWETLIKINKTYGTSIVVVTHNSNIANITDYIIKVKNGKISSFEKNKNKLDPSEMYLGV